MSVYQIDYDLQQPGQEYEDLYDAIQNLGNCVHILESTWFLDASGYTTNDIRDKLDSYVDSNDKILVTRVKEYWAANFSDTDWLYDHL